MIRLSQEQLQIIRTHAESTYQDECCGIILGYLANEGKIVSVQNGKAGALMIIISFKQRQLKI
jgi:proteasome lid subunit RPN8/RPN11